MADSKKKIAHVRADGSIVKGSSKGTNSKGRKPASKTGQRRTQKAASKANNPKQNTPKRKIGAHKKVQFEKPGNMLYPAPAVLVSVADPDTEEPNAFTVAWAGNVCTDPPMVAISVRPERYSYDMIRDSGEFVINLTTKELAKATDFCGVRSGRDVNKFKECGFTAEPCEFISAPMIKESPVSLECEVRDLIELGSHDMFLAEVLNVYVDKAYMDEKGAFHLEDADPIAYSHGKYYALGEELGFFGFSVAKKKK